MPSAQQLIAFTHLPKTAGTSLHHVLRRTFGMRYLVVAKEDTHSGVFTQADLARIRRRYPRLRAFGGHLILPTRELEDIEGGVRFMTMLRRPAERCASHYAHERARRGTTTPFPEWVAQPRLRNAQTRRFSDPADADVAISVFEEKFFFVGLVEEFSLSLDLLRHDVPDLAVPEEAVPRNPSRSGEIKAAVLSDPAALAAIEETQAEDVKLYNYVKNTMWPDRIGRMSTSRAAPPREMTAEMRARLSNMKERVLFGVQRRIAGSSKDRVG